MSFGEELKKLRESKGMTVNQLAVYSGVSAASISRYETGERGIPKPPTIEKLARGLRVPYTDLMKIAGHIRKDKTDQEKHPAEKLLDYISQGLTNEQIKERMDFMVDIMKLSDEEIEEFMSFVRWQLSRKKEQPAVSKSEEP
ncbi:helix-turn-helix domain-containing protein [Paenibacillus sp. GYB003]|uniref:helix-turn-helix domain-containing protein n=1 Tax=Paenibacillus sp. GYB003 TaxID=2994392 RepID=UPI002F968DEA